MIVCGNPDCERTYPIGLTVEDVCPACGFMLAIEVGGDPSEVLRLASWTLLRK